MRTTALLISCAVMSVFHVPTTTLANESVYYGTGAPPGKFCHHLPIRGN
ncbi:hypothetical protein [Vreelandella olivaria]|nr:hypothetical protein [Halomonas olivaria]